LGDKINKKIINGKKIAKDIKKNVGKGVLILAEKYKIFPRLDMILIGDNSESTLYTRAKRKYAKKLGIKSKIHRLPADISEKQVLGLIDELNDAPDTHGILVQLPLSQHISAQKVIDTIDPKKDVDGFTVYNMGNIFLGYKPYFYPCTPQGVIYLLKSVLGGDLSGLDVIMVGRSNIVGKPLSYMMINENMTVTVTHSYTKNLNELCREKDVIVSAVGNPGMIKADWVKEGAVCIDIGIKRRDIGDKVHLVGDFDYEEVIKKAGFITPVPGGVGPMTIAMLLLNTLKAALILNDINDQDIMVY
jgi:methylenetetrahydrofolate dehydrogenase (NADP+)/methenyltetrahydrofolate cyclohydrolase